MAAGHSWIRMSLALSLSILLSLFVGILAATDKTLERIIIPALDVLQSIPILGFFPVALFAFISLHPVLGPELAAIFLIFTSQVWNIAFGVYESVKIIPTESLEMTNLLRLSMLEKVRLLYVPASLPKIFANLPSSWANGLYFLVACEIITVGEAEHRLFGIGSLTVDFITSGMIYETLTALLVVAVLVVLMNLALFIPLIRMSAKYRFEVYATEIPHVWIERVFRPFAAPVKVIPRRPIFSEHWRITTRLQRVVSILGRSKRYVMAFIFLAAAYLLSEHVEAGEITAFFAMVVGGLSRLGIVEPLTMIGYSFARVLTALLITLGWTIPVSILMYEKRVLERMLMPAFQIVASFPATLVMPFIVEFVTKTGIPKEVGALAIVLLGTQWYLLFFLRGALSTIPREEEELARLLRMSRLEKFWYLYLPRMAPSMVSGCIVTVGGGWNTLVVAERTVLDGFVWEVENPGIGKTLSIVTYSGDVGLLVATTVWMALFIVLFNRLVWRRIYEIVVKRVV